MKFSNLAFDDFVDDCLLQNDSFCDYNTNNLDSFVEDLMIESEDSK